MAELTRWSFPPSLQPTQGEVAFDLKSTFDGIVALRAEIPDDAFTASVLGTDRTGNGVVIREDGLILTIGYLITEAATVWLTLHDGSTGQESDGHDWYNLLTIWGKLEQDTVIARWMRMIAWLMCVGSIIIAVWSALQQPREAQIVVDRADGS